MNVARLMRANRRHEIKDAAEESRLFARRALTGVGLALTVLLMLLARYAWLQVVHHEEFTTRSTSNRVRLLPVAPNRGLIYDRRGRPVAENRPAYRLEIVPERAGDLAAVFTGLGAIVDLPEDVREQFDRNRRRYRDFEAVPVKFNLGEKEIARFAVDRHRYPGVHIVPYITRHYPYGELLTHVLGYVGRLDENDLASVDIANYRGTTHIGKIGIERQYESLLHGQSGMQKVETNVEGRIIRSLERQDPVHGADLVLSLDLQVQQAAWNALGDRPGAVVAIDPADGSVLALVSKPAYDPNAFVHGISGAEYREILAAPGRALFNRAIQGGYEPGSTIKPYLGLAGLELGVFSRDRRVFSTGKFFLAGLDRPFRDWRDGGHGWVDIRGALEQSVNSYFYQLALELGIDRMHDYLAQFGFGSPTGIDLPGEAAGVLPSRNWKRGLYGQPWYPGETVIAGIGQGFNVVTPVQLANALAVLVNGGVRRAPRLLYAAKVSRGEQARRVTAPVTGRVAVVDPRNWDAVHEGMRRVVHGPQGTARALQPIEGYELAGKSGTAQVVRLAQDQEYVESEVAEHLRHHALFIAYAPAARPAIVVATVVEHGGGGSRQAAPVAKAVIEAWLGQEAGR